MKVLVVGSGAREHALAWRLATSPSVQRVDTAPGNPGTAALGENHPVAVDDPVAVADLAERLGAELVVVGPEGPLVAGLANELRWREVPVFGPMKEAAQIEASKSFAKEVMVAADVPTARYEVVTDATAAREALERFEPPYVVKADGLAAGKGVSVCADLREAHAAVDQALEARVFGAAGERLVLEEHLEGPEVSVFAVCDGHHARVLAPAQDFKRAHDGDRGPNTGGMGAYSPVDALDVTAAERLVDTVFDPVLRELLDRGTPFVGLLYAGLVLTAAGTKVIEFNCRFGDPETQVVVPKLTTDLGEFLLAAATGHAGKVHVGWSPDAFVTVVLASGGYPGPYEKGREITGVETAAADDGVQVFHAGTATDDGRLVTAGGRVLAVTGRGADVATARAVAYQAADRIRFDGLHRRDDIALAAAHAATREESV